MDSKGFNSAPVPNTSSQTTAMSYSTPMSPSTTEPLPVEWENLINRILDSDDYQNSATIQSLEAPPVQRVEHRSSSFSQDEGYNTTESTPTHEPLSTVIQNPSTERDDGMYRLPPVPSTVPDNYLGSPRMSTPSPEPPEEQSPLSPASATEPASPPSVSQAMVVPQVGVASVNPQSSQISENLVVYQLPSALDGQVQIRVQNQAQEMPMGQQVTVVGMLDVPNLTDMEGEYGFTVSIEEKERTTKTPMWLRSNITNKLYTNINKAVPFEINLKKKVSSQQFCIRAVPVFSSPQFYRANVIRCPNHAAPTDITNHDFPYATHVVRADHPGARYERGPTGRLSVAVPLDVLQDGSGFTPILLRFMCLGSCVGGINRRPIAIILTLENNKGAVCGRKVVDVRVCACPTRDIRSDENAFIMKGSFKRKLPQEKVQVNARKRLKPLEPKEGAAPDDDQIFYIPVRGRQLYNFLLDVKANYYRNHPNYAIKCPDDASFSYSYNSKGSKIGSGRESVTEMSRRGSTIEEIDDGNYDSDDDDSSKPYHTEDEERFEMPTSTSKSRSMDGPQPRISVTPAVKLMVSDNRDQKCDFTQITVSENNETKTWTYPKEVIWKSAPNTPITLVTTSLGAMPQEITTQAGSKIDLANFTKHVPVRQVSSYVHRGPVVRAKSVIAHKVSSSNGPSFALCTNAPIQTPVATKEELRMSPVEVRSDVSIARGSPEEQLSPGSPEMLAANVLAQGFAKEKIIRKK